MKQPTRRTILKMLLLLAAGAAVNVAVAWGCALKVHATSAMPEIISTFEPGRPLGWMIVRYRTSSSLCLAAAIQLTSVDAMAIDDPRIPKWSRIRDLPAYVEGEPMPMLYDLAYGWPSISMRYELDATRDAQTGALIATSTAGAIGEYKLPYRAIWPGFAVNTVLYAAVLWVLLAVLFALRRMIRRRRGQCPACGYPVGAHERCTECGRALP